MSYKYKLYPGDTYTPVLHNFDRNNPRHIELLDYFVDIFYRSSYNDAEDTKNVVWDERPSVTPPLNYLLSGGLTFMDVHDSFHRLYDRCKEECGEKIAEKRYSPEYMILNTLGEMFCEMKHDLLDPKVLERAGGLAGIRLTKAAAMTLEGSYHSRLLRVIECVEKNNFGPIHPALGYLLMVYESFLAARLGYYPYTENAKESDND